MDFKELKNALLKEIMDKKIKQPTDEFNVDRLLFFMEIARNAIIAIKEEGEFLNVKRTEDKNHNVLTPKNWTEYKFGISIDSLI